MIVLLLNQPVLWSPGSVKDFLDHLPRKLSITMLIKVVEWSSCSWFDLFPPLINTVN